LREEGTYSTILGSRLTSGCYVSTSEEDFVITILQEIEIIMLLWHLHYASPYPVHTR